MVELESRLVVVRGGGREGENGGGCGFRRVCERNASSGNVVCLDREGCSNVSQESDRMAWN